MANEETIYTNNNMGVGSIGKKATEALGVSGPGWKQVTLGGVTGILMGAGGMYATDAYVDKTATEKIHEAEGETAHDTLGVAEVDQSMSFGEAFASARAEVGPGGVFYWHGGIYNTFTKEEWDAMTNAEKAEFAEQVRPEIRPEEINTDYITEESPNITPTSFQSQETAHHHGNGSEVEEVQVNVQENEPAQDVEVQVVGFGEMDGHLVVGYDTVGDGEADVAIIDVDNSGDPTAPDIVVTANGDVASLREIAEAAQHMEDPTLAHGNVDNPEVSEGMPDYMDDVMIDV